MNFSIIIYIYCILTFKILNLNGLSISIAFELEDTSFQSILYKYFKFFLYSILSFNKSIAFNNIQSSKTYFDCNIFAICLT